MGTVGSPVGELLNALGKLGEPQALRVVYEAGPCGYSLVRLFCARRCITESTRRWPACLSCPRGQPLGHRLAALRAVAAGAQQLQVVRVVRAAARARWPRPIGGRDPRYPLIDQFDGQAKSSLLDTSLAALYQG